MKAPVFLFFLGVWGSLHAQIGYFGHLGQFSNEPVGVFGDLFLQKGVWYAHGFPKPVVYISPKATIAMTSMDPYMENTIVSTKRSGLLFPLGLLGVSVPINSTQDTLSRISLTLEAEAPIGVPFENKIQISAPFVWSLEGYGNVEFEVKKESLNHWFSDSTWCQWIGNTSLGWETIESHFSHTDALQFSSPVESSRYSKITIVQFREETSLNVAEAITPNGDGINDTWVITPIEHFPNAHIHVMNIRGVVVFESLDNYQNDWTGRHYRTGDFLPTGTYFYSIQWHDDHGKTTLKRGKVVIKTTQK